MSVPSRPLAAIALFLALSGASLAEPPSAVAVIAAAKAASGGAAWDRLAGVAERGTHGGMPYRTWLSFAGYRMRMENGEGASTRVQGFNGSVAWRAQGDGAALASRDPAALREAVTTAFVSNNGYFFPDRFPATSRWLRAETEASRHFDVLEITPQGGRPAEYWFDQASHLLTRVVDRTGTPPVSVEVSDFRRIGGVLAAFHLVVRTMDGTIVDEGQVESVAYGPVDAALFDPPPAPR
jgi:hypothetical protein